MCRYALRASRSREGDGRRLWHRATPGGGRALPCCAIQQSSNGLLGFSQLARVMQTTLGKGTASTPRNVDRLARAARQVTLRYRRGLRDRWPHARTHARKRTRHASCESVMPLRYLSLERVAPCRAVVKAQPFQADLFTTEQLLALSTPPLGSLVHRVHEVFPSETAWLEARAADALGGRTHARTHALARRRV